MPDTYIARVRLHDGEEHLVTRVPRPDGPCESFTPELWPSEFCWRCSWHDDEHECERLLQLVARAPGGSGSGPVTSWSETHVCRGLPRGHPLPHDFRHLSGREP